MAEPVAIVSPEEKRYRELTAEIERLDRLCWLLLQQIHAQINDMHSPKARFDRGELAGVWIEYREKYKVKPP